MRSVKRSSKPYPSSFSSASGIGPDFSKLDHLQRNTARMFPGWTSPTGSLFTWVSAVGRQVDPRSDIGRGHLICGALLGC